MGTRPARPVVLRALEKRNTMTEAHNADRGEYTSISLADDLYTISEILSNTKLHSYLSLTDKWHGTNTIDFLYRTREALQDLADEVHAVK